MDTGNNFARLLNCGNTITPPKYPKGFDAFYDDWYSGGYLMHWPDKVEARVLNMIKSLKLPEFGDALDYGCGNGILTSIIKRALPKWNVYGLDISKIAIENAKKGFLIVHFLFHRIFAPQERSLILFFPIMF